MRATIDSPFRVIIIHGQRQVRVTYVKDLDRIVRDEFRKRFPDAKLVSLELEEDSDYEGDPIIRVRITFEAESDRLDPNKTSGFLRHLLPALLKGGEAAFPIVSYIAKNDPGVITAEAS